MQYNLFSDTLSFCNSFTVMVLSVFYEDLFKNLQREREQL